MKYTEKYIYLVIGLILGAFLVGAMTFCIINKKENKQESKEPIEEKITLTEEELKKYLSYVPNNLQDNPVKESDSVYRNPKTVLNINKSVILSKVLNDLFNECRLKNICETTDKVNFNSEFSEVLSRTKIDQAMLERYNINNYEILKTDDSLVGSYNTYCFYYKDNYFNEDICTGGSSNLFSAIESYEANKEELIIYEYAAVGGCSQDTGTCGLYNYLDSKEILKDLKYEELKDEFEAHKTVFAKYKHTFKKNDTGYYWHSTEVVN